MSSRARTAEAPRKPKPRRRALIRVKRAYDVAGSDDGIRILVDRLWPRGVSKSTLAVNLWPREITPSTALRKWYRHDPERFAEFRERYLEELAVQADALAELRKAVRGKTVTLVTATRALDVSHAGVLREVLARGRR
jgi:uncharacterized protein YeaO (DUF488 family)